jgi:SAM-dependent methyltransferase
MNLPEYQKKILAFYNDWYATNPTQIKKYRSFETSTLISLLEPHRGGLIVDIGFGNIPFLQTLHERGFQTCGENICETAIQQAQVIAPELHLVRCAMPEIYSKGAAAIIARHCLYHVHPEDLKRLARSIETSLIVGGHFFFLHDLDPTVDPNPNINFFHTAEDINQIILENSSLKQQFLQKIEEEVHLEGKVIGKGPVWLSCFEKTKS